MNEKDKIKALESETRMLRQQLRLIQQTLHELLSESEHPGQLPLSDLILRIRVLGGEAQRYKDEADEERQLAHEAYQKGLRDASEIAEAVEWCGANRATVEFTPGVLPHMVRLSYPGRGPFPIEGASLVEAVRLARMGEEAGKI
jgi:hypothetical protein